MKTVYSISRVLLGLTFLTFGLNGFLHFIPMAMPTGLALQFVGALAQSHYMTFVFALEVIGAVLLLVTRYQTLALTILAPITVNIVLFHALMAPAGLPLAVIAVVLWAGSAYPVRDAFAGLLQARG